MALPTLLVDPALLAENVSRSGGRRKRRSRNGARSATGLQKQVGTAISPVPLQRATRAHPTRMKCTEIRTAVSDNRRRQENVQKEKLGEDKKWRQFTEPALGRST